MSIMYVQILCFCISESVTQTVAVNDGKYYTCQTLVILDSPSPSHASCKFGQSATTDQKQITKLGWGARRPLKPLTWSAGTSSAISSTVLLYAVLLLFMIGSRHMRNRPYINIRPNTTITNIITTCKIH